MKEEKYLEKINPERREFVKKIVKASYVVPIVTSVAMLEQKLDLSTAHAQTRNVVR